MLTENYSSFIPEVAKYLGLTVKEMVKAFNNIETCPLCVEVDPILGHDPIGCYDTLEVQTDRYLGSF